MQCSMASILNFLYLLSLPTSSEQIKAIQKLAENEKVLLKKIFKKETYDYSLPSESPTIVLPFMFIDHIEQLDQTQQLMNMHCSMLFHWTDKRIVWEPRDYGNVDKIVRHKSDLPRMWFPAVHFTEMKLRSDQAMQYFNTEVTLISNGAVYAQVILTIRSTCSLDFTAYPNDVQSCLLTMFTPLPMSRLKFSKWASLTQRSDIFGSLMNEPRPIRSGEFEVANLSATPLFVLPFGKITANESADRPEMMRSIIRFEIRFRRIIQYYWLTIVLPLFCLTTLALFIECFTTNFWMTIFRQKNLRSAAVQGFPSAGATYPVSVISQKVVVSAVIIAVLLFCVSRITYMAGTVTNASSSIVWLLLCFAAQILNYTQMLSRLPPDQQNTPFCAKMATIVLAETFALIVFRTVMTYKYNHHMSVEGFVGCSTTKRIERTLRILLVFHTLLNAVLLFS